MRLTTISRSLGLILPGIALLGMTGCATLEWNSFIDPGEPHIVLGPGESSAPRPILDSLNTLDNNAEPPDSAFGDATDVRPDDLVSGASEYQIGKNDLLSVSIYDLLGEGTGEQVKQVRVSETGTVSVPFISPVKVEGLTETEAGDAIKVAYQVAQQIRDARVMVTVIEARGRTFSIQGNVGNPGEYQITRPDFRMLDAMVTAKAPVEDQGVPYAYVIRTYHAPTTVPSVAPASGGGATTAPSTTMPDLLAPPQPHSRANPPTNSRGVVLADNTTGTATPDPLAPGTDAAPGATTSTPAADDKFSGFNDLHPTSETRVIRVPIDALRQRGELKYNIVIRPSDMIIVPDPVVGEYYIGGHLLRTGVYSLSARKITLKEAWTAAGGQDQAAIPARTEIIRRVGDNSEVFVRVNLDKVWSGEEPDIYLKPYDIVQVGTDFWAPFLSAIRNSFRLTYGFGFLYDRNYYTGPSNGL